MITHAAIKHNEVVYTGKRHSDIMKEIMKAHPEIKHFTKYQQGFVTDRGEYLTRKEAFVYAIIHKQVRQENLINKNILTSEDLW
jgi:hypothetical protein